MPGEPDLAPGATGEWVQYLQQNLAYCRLMNSSEEGFGSATETAVREFQRAAGLSETGRADGTTWAGLLALTNDQPEFYDAEFEESTARIEVLEMTTEEAA